MTALEQANKLLAEGMGYQPNIGCSCGGYWWTDGGETVAATHDKGCPHAEKPPPKIPARRV